MAEPMRLALAATVVACIWAPSIGQAAPVPAVLSDVEWIKANRPALWHREKARPDGVSWARLRRTARAQWIRTHPAWARTEGYRLEADKYRTQFMCIAGHESSTTWNISTGNGYYGGLQMDRTFQATYGPELYGTKGTADRWTADEQIAVASRAVPGRGFHPWPNTGRMCGLL